MKRQIKLEAMVFVAVFMLAVIGGMGYCYWIGQSVIATAILVFGGWNALAFFGKRQLPTIKDLI